MSTTEQVITEQVLRDAMDYSTYRKHIDELLAEGKTTGPNQSDDLTNYTKINVHRMKRLDKQVELQDSLKDKLRSVQEPVVWLVLTEGWCGDAAQNVPVLAKMAEASESIELELILRDEHLDIMDEHLTNGGRSIPKLICLDADSLEEKGEWGPRPQELQKVAMEWKNDADIRSKEWAERVHKWYAVDKTQEIQREFEKLLEQWNDS